MKIASFSPIINLIPAEYFTQMSKDSYQCQLTSEGILTAVNESQIHRHLLRNVFISLRSQLKPKEANLYALNLPLKLRHFRLNALPDLVITAPEDPDLGQLSQPWLEPRVIIEVSSPNDRRERKFYWYRQLASLREYVLIEPNYYLIQHFAKVPGMGWSVSQIDDWGESVSVANRNCQLSLCDVYYKVTFGTKNR